MPALLKVRAVVAAEADKLAFDKWYQDEHLPDAHRAFNATHAWRAWSEVEPLVHYAFYSFESLERAQAIMDSPQIKTLIAEFDRLWHGRVTRERDVLEVAQTIDVGSMQ